MESSEIARRTFELDRATYPDFRDRIVRADAEPAAHEPRSYPGYPRVALPRERARRLVALDRVLVERRTVRRLTTEMPGPRALGRLLQFAHGVWETNGRGPTPSAGGLQALELYAVAFAASWLDAGVYHYDRAGHHLSRVVAGADRARWDGLVPSSQQFEGGALLWLVVGDGERVERKYGARGFRFLLLEAGHLMQNLCLVSESLGLSTLPLGGCFEREIARELALPAGDVVLYAGACGAPRPSSER
jgi:SagB-type dehydrogenase family enzyme